MTLQSWLLAQIESWLLAQIESLSWVPNKHENMDHFQCNTTEYGGMI